MTLQCITIFNRCNNLKKNIYLKMPLNKKSFLYYCRISIQEGLYTELSHSELEMGNYDKYLYQICRFCYRVFEIEKAFKESKDICKQCFKLLKMEDIKDKISPKIYVFWNDNQEYRICTNIYHSFANSVFRKENIRDKEGKISKGKALNIYLNSSI